MRESPVGQKQCHVFKVGNDRDILEECARQTFHKRARVFLGPEFPPKCVMKNLSLVCSIGRDRTKLCMELIHTNQRGRIYPRIFIIWKILFVDNEGQAL
jgi:hypothetical protein